MKGEADASRGEKGSRQAEMPERRGRQRLPNLQEMILLNKQTNNETFKCEVLYRNSHPYQKSDRCGYQKKKDRGVSLKEKRSF